MVDKNVTDTFYVFDSIPGSGEKEVSDTIAFEEDIVVNKGVYPYTRPFTARILNTFKSYATILEDQDG